MYVYKLGKYNTSLYLLAFIRWLNQAISSIILIPAFVWLGSEWWEYLSCLGFLCSDSDICCCFAPSMGSSLSHWGSRVWKECNGYKLKSVKSESHKERRKIWCQCTPGQRTSISRAFLQASSPGPGPLDQPRHVWIHDDLWSLRWSHLPLQQSTVKRQQLAQICAGA